MNGITQIRRGARGLSVILASALGIAASAWNWNTRADEAQTSKFLICAETVAPAGCDASNAVTVLARPAGAKDVGCGVQGPEVLAGSGLAARDGQYVKVACASKTAQAH